MNPSNNKADILSVSRLNSEIRAVVDGSFPLLWIEGEISNLATPRSGHLYFSLKDAHAQVRCAMFRNKRLLLRTQPGGGDKVLVRAKVSLYEPRGDLQLIVEHIEPAGEGDLQQAFEALKQKLAAEGLFEQQHKLPLPRYPGCIGIITSPQGAAVRDVLHVLARRYPAAKIIIYPTLVQGTQAPQQIVDALTRANNRNEVDLLILTRGGGSLEDLMAFNDETVARKIAAISIPLISAIGHEVDFSIADFVADKRAPTPSAAAEIAVPEHLEIQQKFELLLSRLQRNLQHLITLNKHQLQGSQQRLMQLHPLQKIHQHQQQVDQLGIHLERTLKNRWTRKQEQLHHLMAQLQSHSPRRLLTQRLERLNGLHHRLLISTRHHHQQQRTALSVLIKQLHALSPLAVLSRGYSLSQSLATGEVIRHGNELTVGDQIETRFANGSVISRVESIK